MARTPPVRKRADSSKKTWTLNEMLPSFLTGKCFDEHPFTATSFRFRPTCGGMILPHSPGSRALVAAPLLTVKIEITNRPTWQRKQCSGSFLTHMRFKVNLDYSLGAFTFARVIVFALCSFPYLKTDNSQPSTSLFKKR